MSHAMTGTLWVKHLLENRLQALAGIAIDSRLLLLQLARRSDLRPSSVGQLLVQSQ